MVESYNCPRCGSCWEWPADLIELEFQGKEKHLLIYRCSNCDLKVTGCGDAHTMEPSRNVHRALDGIYYWMKRHEGYTAKELDFAIINRKLGE